MALTQSQLEQLMSTITKKGTDVVPNLASQAVDTKQQTIDNLTKQISNTSTRLAAVGEDATKIADTRNPLEKILNLTPDQSFIFDIFDLIGRSQKALFGATQAAFSEGETGIGEGFLAGLTGQYDDNSVNFKTVLQEMTDSDLGDVKGEFNLIDIVGFAGDVLLDPADLALMMVSGGTSLTGQIADAAIDASKVTDVAKASDTAVDTFKGLGKVQDFVFGEGKRIAKLSTSDYLKALTQKDFRKTMQLEAESITSLTFKGMKGAFKGASQLTDVALTKGFDALDGTKGLSKGYEGFKLAVEAAASKKGKELKHVIGTAQLKMENAYRMFMGEDKNFINIIDSLASESGLDKGLLNVYIYRSYEDQFLSTKVNPKDFIKLISGASENSKRIRYTEETYNQIIDIFGDELKPYMKVVNDNGFDVIQFDSKFFSKDNADVLEQFTKKGVKQKVSTVYDAKTTAEYEKVLEAQDIRSYREYTARKRAYESKLSTKVDARFKKEMGYAYEESSKNKKIYDKIKQAIKEEDLKLNPSDLSNPQVWLKNQTNIAERYTYVLLDDERKAIRKAMSGSERYQFNKQYNASLDQAKAIKNAALKEDAIKRVNYTYDEVLRKYAKDNALTDIENKAFTDTLKNVDNAGYINIGRFETAEMRKTLDDLKTNETVQKGVKAYQELLHNTQRIIGQTEFDDAESLLRMSMEGYTTHTLNPNFTEALQKVRDTNPDAFKNLDFAYFAPGKTSAVKARQMLGTTYEQNEFVKTFYKQAYEDSIKKLSEADQEFARKAFDEGMFAEQATASIFAFMTESYGAINKNKRLADVLIAGAFRHPEDPSSAFRVLSSGGDVPIGMKKLDNGEVGRLMDVLRANEKFQGKSHLIDSIMEELKTSLRDDKMAVMESHLAEMFLNTNKAKPKDALRILDAINNGFKVGKTLSIGFNVKNIAGNAMNQWLSGVPVNQMFSNWNEAMRLNKEIQDIDKIIIDPAKGFASLTDSQKTTYQIYHEFMEAGFMSRASVYKLNDMGLESERWIDPAKQMSAWKSAIENPITAANMDVNLWFDNHFRLSLYLYARGNVDYLTKLGIDPTATDAAMQAVRLVHFDPNDLTFFEDDVMKRLVPFYTFTRQNMAFQLQNITRHSVKYNRLFKAYDAYNMNMFDVAQTDLQQYQREQMYVPLWKKKDGEYVVVKASFPMVALTELTFNSQDFLQNVVSKTTPLIRAPYEAATGVQTFTGQPIERYEGELSTRIPMFNLTKGTEWLMGQVGMDVPLGTIAQTAQGVSQLLQGEDATKSFGKATNVINTMNIQDAQLSKLYSTIESLSAREKVLKSKGVEIPTLDAIQAASTNTKLSVQSQQLQKINDLINNIKR